jgi:hypothetical protein
MYELRVPLKHITFTGISSIIQENRVWDSDPKRPSVGSLPLRCLQFETHKLQGSRAMNLGDDLAAH